MRNILIISHDKVGTKMAGPGIRYHYMAEMLSKNFDVTMGFFSPENLPDEKFERNYKVKQIDVHSFESGFINADAIIALWLSEAIINFCNLHKKIVVIDIYAPVPVENMAVNLFSDKKIDKLTDFTYESSILDYKLFLRNADAFLCSNKRQVDFWLGFAFGTGDINPSGYVKRPIFDQFIIAPMGIDSKEKLIKTKQLYKGQYKGVEENDIVLVWNGGIYDWYDGVSLIEAMALVWKKNKNIKIIFPGTQHPNGSLPKWAETVKTINKAKELKIIDKNIFFFEGWFDYGDRINFLLEADGAIYTHKMSIETEFSHRTRVLDHILAELPTVATAGDYFADLVQNEDIGIVAEPGNIDSIANAILDLCEAKNMERFKKNLNNIKDSFDWNNTLSGLQDYLESNPSKTYHPPSVHRRGATKSKPYKIAKRITPKGVKKVIVKATPMKIRRKVLGK